MPPRARCKGHKSMRDKHQGDEDQVGKDQVGKDQVAKDQVANGYVAKDYVLRIKDTFRTHPAQKRPVSGPPPLLPWSWVQLVPTPHRNDPFQAHTPLLPCTPHRKDPFRTHHPPPRTETTR